MIDNEMTNQERLDKVARDLRGNRTQLTGKIEASQLELDNDRDMLKNFDVAITALETAGAAKEEVTQAPLPFAPGADQAPAADVAETGPAGTEGQGAPL